MPMSSKHVTSAHEKQPSKRELPRPQQKLIFVKVVKVVQVVRKEVFSGSIYRCVCVFFPHVRTLK